MALINCPECGREKISDSATACPGCGFNIEKWVQECRIKEQAALAKEQAEAREKEQTEADYNKAEELCKTAKTVTDYKRICDIYTRLGEYKDSPEKLKKYTKVYKREKAAQTRKLKLITVAVCAVCLLTLLIFVGVDFIKYRSAISSYNNAEYDEAVEKFGKLHVFSGESYLKSLEIEKNYQRGLENEKEGLHGPAAERFAMCGDYKDAVQRLKANKIYNEYDQAISCLEEGKLKTGKEKLEDLPDDFKKEHPDVEEYIDLVDKSIASGWGGVWLHQSITGSLSEMDVIPKIKDKELYVEIIDRMSDTLATTFAEGKVEGNKATFPDKEFEAILVSYDTMDLIVEYTKVSDYADYGDDTVEKLLKK